MRLVSDGPEPIHLAQWGVRTTFYGETLMDRREMLGMIGAGAIGLTAMSARADEKSSGGRVVSSTRGMKRATRPAPECAKACDMTFHHCVKKWPREEGARQGPATCVRLRAFCALSACMIAKHSSLMVDSCQACGEACRDGRRSGQVRLRGDAGRRQGTARLRKVLPIHGRSHEGQERASGQLILFGPLD